MRHMCIGRLDGLTDRPLPPNTNLSLTVGRAGQVIGGGEWNIVLCTDTISDLNLFRRGGQVFLPLYCYGKANMNAEPLPSMQPIARTPNLNPAFIRDCEAKLNLRFVAEANGEPDTFSPEDVFFYTYAIFHSPMYRERYAAFLEIDFPRLPLTTSITLFRRLNALGGELVAWHLLKHYELEGVGGIITSFPESGDNLVENSKSYPCYKDSRQRVYINKEQYFESVSPELWEHMIGGYQVLRKWLVDRKGRQLSYEDVQHYQRIVRSLHETQRLMRAIDEAIGSFPLP